MRRIPRPSIDSLRHAYIEEEQPMRILAKKYKVSLSTMFNWFRAYGIPSRSHSEAKRLDFAKGQQSIPPNHTGKKRTHEDLCRRALNKQKNPRLSRYEELLFKTLLSFCFKPIPHMAIDKFNIDFAFPDQRLAVELDGGCWHNTPKKRQQDEAKTTFLQSDGWIILRIKARRHDWLDTAIWTIMRQLHESIPRIKSKE
jgi:very-short-patch-repair endonuclease